MYDQAFPSERGGEVTGCERPVGPPEGRPAAPTAAAAEPRCEAPPAAPRRGGVKRVVLVLTALAVIGAAGFLGWRW